MVAFVATVAVPRAAEAFCGFYVAGADTKLYNNATMVTMMRDGTTTVLSMRNNYQGPPEEFALVVPVPVVLHKDNVKTLPPEVFDRIDKMAAPRLVEYWEQDPCAPQVEEEGYMGTGRGGGGTGVGYGVGSSRQAVRIEAQFTVAEYEIVILSADDATALESWLTGHGYKIPAGAANYLRPYVEGGSKFFVAKVNPDKVTFKDGMATLSPLRFHYESKDFSLPIRLGLINAKGSQDLIVHILARNTRYEAANYDNVTIPTNLFVNDGVRDRFGEFYAALFDATLEKHPNAVVTEYAWGANSCDPCPEPTLTATELTTLGMDVLGDKGSSIPTVRLRQIEVRGDLDKNIIRRYVRRVMPKIRYCYQNRLANNPGLSGNATAQFMIGADGKVMGKPKVDFPDRATASCIEGILAAMIFPKPRSGTVIVKQPLDLVQQPVGGGAAGWVLTRLHTRYDASHLGDDLVFRTAPPIVGGRGGAGDGLSKEATPSSFNNFQGRYIIRHPWTGAVPCGDPHHGMWGGRPGGDGESEPRTARDTAFARRGQLALAAAVAEPVASLGLTPTGGSLEAKPAPETPPPAPAPAKKKSKHGCGCSSSSDSGGSGLLLALALVAVTRRRRAGGRLRA